MTFYMPSTQELHTNTVIESVSPTDNIISFSGEGTQYREEEGCGRNHCEHTGYRKSRLGSDHENQPLSSLSSKIPLISKGTAQTLPHEAFSDAFV